MATITERVERGAAYLDEREPGWWQRINLDLLDLQSPCECVLGQLATGLPDRDNRMWHEIAAHFGLDIFGGDDDKYGFDSPVDSNRAYANLTAAWRKLIKTRRAGA